jgi:hypothetical protein
LLLLLLLVPPPAQALQTLDVEGVHLVYPSQEAHLAVRLAAKIPDMTAFLAERGLPLVTPLHVIIDPERDRPRPEVHIIPHRQIRIPLRAPGVFEDGCLEADPWAYFLFMGLCRHGIFQQVSGLPGNLRYLFGQMMSPNALSPAWIHDGVAHYLYQAYHPGARRNPLDELIRTHVPPPDLAHLSNHSETWPGPDIYRIYGRDFIAWVVDGYGWDAMLAFFRFHGRGLLPVEVATKAQRAFGATWADLWAVYRSRWSGEGDDTVAGADIGADAGGTPLVGMTTDGRSHWNAARVSPGPQRFRRRGRHGHQTPDGTIWLSELDDEGGLELVAYRAKGYRIGRPHTWDPGHGGVAVGRGGSRPVLLLFDPETGFDTEPRQIPAPPGVIQLSGPVRADDGSVAVAGNVAGQWDIWIFDGAWHRETREPGLDVDPWIESGPGGTRLVFASNRSGRFQLYEAVDRGRPRPVSACTSAALLPRGNRYLCLGAEGWRRLDLPTPVAESLTRQPRETSSAERQPAALPDPREPERLSSAEAARPYSALKSVWPNYVRPDMFYRGSDLQLGLATRGEDLSREVGIDGGFRYSFDLDHLSWRMGGRSHGLGARVTRYPIEYDPLFRPEVAEDRLEAQLSWEVVEDPELTLSTNYRQVDALHGGGSMDDHFWGGAHLGWDWGMGTIWSDLELFTEVSQSLFGGGRLQMGREIVTVLQAMGGKTWGAEVPGTTSYRIGGNVAEGFFTQRPSRLFPIRGFSQNLLESDQAAVSHLEVFWPLANLQKGYGTLPLFLHRLRLGTFVDGGMAADTVAADELLVGAGVELVTSMEIIWGFRSMFRLGIAWPVHQPDALDEKGPVVLIQLGRPL